MIGALGDLFSQHLESKGKKEAKSVDFRRLLIFTISAGFYFAPVIGAVQLPQHGAYSGGDGAKALGMFY